MRKVSKKILITFTLIILMLFAGSVIVRASLSNDLTGTVTGKELMDINHSGAWNFGTIEIFCVDHGDRINSWPMGTIGSTETLQGDSENPSDYTIGGPIRNACKYSWSRMVHVENLEEGAYEYYDANGNPQKQSYQGIAYILSSSVSGRDKQEAIWCTGLNAYNTGRYPTEYRGSSVNKNNEYAGNASDPNVLAGLASLEDPENEYTIHTDNAMAGVLSTLTKLDQLSTTTTLDIINLPVDEAKSKIMDADKFNQTTFNDNNKERALKYLFDLKDRSYGIGNDWKQLEALLVGNTEGAFSALRGENNEEILEELLSDENKLKYKFKGDGVVRNLNGFENSILGGYSSAETYIKIFTAYFQNIIDANDNQDLIQKAQKQINEIFPEIEKQLKTITSEQMNKINGKRNDIISEIEEKTSDNYLNQTHLNQDEKKVIQDKANEIIDALKNINMDDPFEGAINTLNKYSSTIKSQYNDLNTTKDKIPTQVIDSNGNKVNNTKYDIADFLTKMEKAIYETVDEIISDINKAKGNPSLQQQYLNNYSNLLKERLKANGVSEDTLDQFGNITSLYKSKLEEYYNTKGSATENYEKVLEDAQEFTNYIKQLQAKGNLENTTKVDASKAKTAVNNDESEYKYLVGPFTVDYFFYPYEIQYKDLKNDAGQTMSYFSQISEIKVQGINGSILDSQLVDKDGNPFGQGQDYKYPKPGDKFYLKVKYNPAEYAFKILVSIDYANVCEGQIAELKDTANVLRYIHKTSRQNEGGTGYTYIYKLEEVTNETQESQLLIAVNTKDDIYRVKRNVEHIKPDVTFKEDDKPEWGLELLKVDEDGNGLNGAKFDVTVRKDGQDIPVWIDELSSSTNNGRTKTISGLDETGRMSVVIHESQAPEGYDKLYGDITVTFDVDENGISSDSVSGTGDGYEGNKIISYTKDDTNKIIQIIIENKNTTDDDDHHDDDGGGKQGYGYDINFEKVDKDDGKAYLANAEFKVVFYQDNNSDGKVNKGDKKLETTTVKTDKNGKGSITNLKHTGNIVVEITETEAPSGYERLTGSMTMNYKAEKNGKNYKIVGDIEIEISDKDNASTSGNTVTIKNTKPDSDKDKKEETLPYSLNLYKVDSKTNVRLEGAEFKVTFYEDTNDSKTLDEKDELLGTKNDIIIDDSGMFKIDELSYEGTIFAKIEETKAPDGYEKINGDIVIRYKTTKESVSSGNWTEVVDGKEITHTFSRNEIKIADLNIINNINNSKITIDNNRVLCIEVPNTKIHPYSIELFKVDEDTQKLLDGAEFTVEFLDNSGNRLEDGLKDIIAQNGIGTIKDLDYEGNVTIKITEIKTPTGYVKLENPIEVKYNAQKVNNGWKLTSSNDTNINIENGQNARIGITINNKPTIGYIWTTMKLGGYVFEDEKSITKGQEKNDQFDGGEEFPGVEVTLYSTDSDTPLAKTISDDNGYYLFNNLDPMKKYYVTFTYNGYLYENITPLQGDWAVSSKASEDASERDSLNSQFATISAYPNNYIGKNGTNTAFLLNKIEEMEKQLRNGIIEYMSSHNGEFPSDKYSIFTNDNEKRFMMDTEITSSTNPVVTTNFAEDDHFIINDKDNVYHKVTEEYDAETGEWKEVKGEIRYGDTTVKVEEGEVYEGILDNDYLYIYDRQLQVNMGIEARPELDLEIKRKALTKATVTVNGKTEEYNYSNTASVEKILETRTADMQDEVDANIDLLYEIMITNKSDTIGAVTQLVDFYNADMYEIKDIEIRKGTDIAKGSISTDSVDQTINGFGTKLINIPDDEKLRLGNNESLYVYVTLSLTPNGKDMLYNLKERDSIQSDNIVEINQYKTYYDKETPDSPGILDRDSIPGNLTKQFNQLNEDIRDKTNWEDDTAIAKFSNVYQKPRTFTGNVYEVLKDNAASVQDISNGKAIDGINVKLIELVKDGIVTREKTKYETNTEEGGKYKFEGYIPGDYVVRFTYGDKTYTVDGNSKVYSGEEYQSVKANPNTRNTENGNKVYWYTNTDARYSDAYDEVGSRQKAIDFLANYKYDKASLINSSEKATGEEGEYSIDGNRYVNDTTTYSVNGNEMTVKEALTIDAYTAPLELEVEYAKTQSQGSTSKKPQDRTYEVKNVDFGIAQRPESKVRIEKTIKDVTITLQDGTVLIDHATPENIGDQLVEYARKLGDNLHFEVDDEILNGSTLQVTYDIKVTNEGDPSTLTYFYAADNKPIAIGYYGEEYNEMLYGTELDGTKIERHVGGQYKVTDYDTREEVPVTTKADNVIDYVQSNYTFDTELTEDNKYWESVQVDEDTGKIIDNETEETLVGFDNASKTLRTYQTILKTKSDVDGNKNPITIPLVPEKATNESTKSEYKYKDEEGNEHYFSDEYSSTARTTITLSKVLTPTEDLDFSNSVEIVEITNSSGRVDHRAIPGNYNPEDKTPDEPDSSETSIVNITDPTGENKSYTWAIITVVAAGILAGGIVLIKKYVIDPRK